MRKLILLAPLLLTACFATVPVERHFPDVPNDLMKSCPDLMVLDPNTTKLSEVVGSVATNYSQYHECRMKNDTWIEWYSKQKQIFEEVK